MESRQERGWSTNTRDSAGALHASVARGGCVQGVVGKRHGGTSTGKGRTRIKSGARGSQRGRLRWQPRRCYLAAKYEMDGTLMGAPQPGKTRDAWSAWAVRGATAWVHAQRKVTGWADAWVHAERLLAGQTDMYHAETSVTWCKLVCGII